MKKIERLDKVLAHSGWGTRSEIKKLVKRGAVTVNGIVAKDSGQKLNPTVDEITVDGQEVAYKPLVYYLMNKPQGVVSATEDKRDKTVLDLLGPEAAHYRLFPVGRLDKDTEGLLLLTNDGPLAHELLSPKKHVPKTYFAEIKGRVTDREREMFEKGVELDDGYVTLPARLKILDEGNEVEPARIELTLTEGKFHQVKRMFQAVGKKVLYLQRISMGSLQLDRKLRPGEYRELAKDEIDLLRTQGNV
ncbi:pseudouridine synthase [Paenibacillus senegalensis]|uniref:pseudouridine synthase n=1 Tax=Paenibacillus senegalensis TaxID=1465766 RepID=UPI00028A35BA|nr:pseudouridine synthase [Paenibacillus senegalensis]